MRTGRPGNTRSAATGAGKSAPTDTPIQIAAPSNTVACILLALLCFAYSWRPLDGASDWWSHAAVGRWIVEHAAVPRHTLFLWSASQDWVAHSWLSEVAIYEVMKIFGDRGGPYAALALTGLISAGVVLWAGGYFDRGNRPDLAFILLTLVAIRASEWRFQARPETFAFVFFVGLLKALAELDKRLSRVEPDKSRRWPLLVAIPAIILAWANCHGGVATGLLVAEAWLAEIALRNRSWVIRRELALTGLAAAIATSINPYGLHYYSIYREVSTQTFSLITEWLPFWVTPTLEPEYVVCAFAGLFAAVYAWIRCKDRRIAHLFLLVLMTLFFVKARRNMMFLSVSALFVTAESGLFQCAPMSSRWTLTLRGASAWIARLVPVAAAAIGIAAYSALLFETVADAGYWPPQAVSSVDMPIDQANFVLKAAPRGRVFNDYNNGAYLDWRFHGSPELFIDSADAFPDSLTDMEIQVLSATPSGLEYLDRSGVDCVIGRRRMPGEPDIPPLYKALNADPRWTLTYFKFEGPVWMRNAAGSRQSPK
jgi:hypothetical protein